MARCDIQHPDTGEWACFSTVSGQFITDWMPETAYVRWLGEEYIKSIELTPTYWLPFALAVKKDAETKARESNG